MKRRPNSSATADDVLRYVAGYQDWHGYSPSYQEICDACGLHSKSSADSKLNRLERAGWLRRLRNRRRAIEILRPVAIPRLPDGTPLYFVEPRP